MYGIVFILSNIKVDGYEDPIVLTQNYVFRKAKPEEITRLKESLVSVSSRQSPLGKRDYIYEFDTRFHETEDITSTNIIKTQREEKDYLYWVIEYQESNFHIHKMEEAILLLSNSFELGFSLDFRGNTSFGSSHYMESKYRDMERSYFKYLPTTVHVNEIKQIPLICDLFDNVREQYKLVDAAIQNYKALKFIDNNSSLIFVGYFSIIESLVTHPPRLHESLDSISHQLTNKITLLAKMFERNIIYSDYFDPKAKDETIWKKLYSYRSNIAHGNKVDFNSDLQILKSKENIQLFLVEVIKNLILLSLKKPEFLSDLKKC